MKLENNIFKIAGIEEVLWNVFGEQKAFGGALANWACYCSTLEAETYVVSCIGNDQTGHEGLNFLVKHGVNISGNTISEAFETGIVNVELDAEGKPEYEIRENVAWNHIPFYKRNGRNCRKNGCSLLWFLVSKKHYINKTN